VAGCHRLLQGSLGDRAAEHIRQHRAGPLPGKQLFLGEVHPDRCDPRPVLDRRRDLRREHSARLGPAAGAALGLDL